MEQKQKNKFKVVSIPSDLYDDLDKLRHHVNKEWQAKHGATIPISMASIIGLVTTYYKQRRFNDEGSSDNV